MTSESFKNAAEGIQAIFISVSILAGGIWAYHKFTSTLQTEQAQATLDKTLDDIKKTPVINTKIKFKYTFTNEGKKYLLVQVQLQNIGREPVELKIENTPEEAPVKARLMIESQGKLVGSEKIIPALLKYADHIPVSTVLLPQRVEFQEYVIPIELSGIYLVQYKVKAPDASVKYATKITESDNSTTESFWISDAIYISIKPNKENTLGKNKATVVPPSALFSR